jgi:hypothetical protein
MNRKTRRDVGRGAAVGFLLSALLVAAPGGLAAQKKATPDSAKAKPAEPAELVMVREVFDYPDTPRRNPFVPLSSADQGPRFEDLRLMGVIYDDKDPAASVAMLGTSSVRTSQDSTSVTVTPRGQTYYRRVGETAGNVRVVEIHPTWIVVEVDDFGIAQRKTMRMATQGGTQ